MLLEPSSVLLPLLFWGGLFFMPMSRSVKITIAVIVVLMGFIGYANAQALPSAPSLHPVTISGNVTTFGPATATAANAASYTFGHAANGPVYAESQSVVRTASGNTVPVTVRSSPSPANIAKALGGVARAATGLVTVIAVGSALYDVAREFGFTFGPNGSVTKDDPAVCTVSPCFGYKAYTNSGNQIGTFTTLGAAQAWYINYWNGGASVGTVTWAQFSNGSQFYWNATSSIYGVRSMAIGTYTVPPVSTAPGVPATVQEFEDAVAARTAWPATSRINDALRDAVQAGNPLPLPKPSTVTGVPEVVNPPKTVTNPDGSKTVTTTKDKLNYRPDGVEVRQETTTQALDPLGNVTGTTTTTEAAPAPKEDPITCGLPGTPACKIDETGTPKDNPITDAKITDATNAVKTAQDSLLEKVVGDADKSWSWTLLGAPPVAQCEVISYPAVMGVKPPDMNPCGTVDGIRDVMAWIWAFSGFWLCVGYVREVI